ncbi:23S rRNA (guanosine(2251)-2'-O)-methyltransferase RlmB [Salisediminibacterium halotolerans]|uniref:23S rRNA (Guanosine2251-2'-O)-methyltransferase n=1 Tax=Salisediminibacterium halotolerans TaxID=517425 RepID=A0A1H9US63_9BACI|nr:23S rRNA (guanosine(2251)-2'-O)-methyltransferase RlmB [Salisediminibacterium haloalkalitolerans]SES11853.1 23S rRNA (guanosine2251-2'-O)-methyltransferase [Salisediminibacterium haloalkalitolerans]
MASEDYIAGKNPVIEALKGEQTVHKVWVAEGSQRGQMNEVVKLAKSASVQLQFVPKKKLDQLYDSTNHQGVVAQVAAFKYADLDALFLEADKHGEEPFFLLLDEIEDPHNLGAILRTADAAGVHGVIIPKRRAAGLTSTVAKASAGAVSHVPVARVTNLARTMEELKNRGLWFAGTDADAPADYRDLDAAMPICLVIGSEGKGLSRLVKEKCDFLIRLPLKGHVTSLNASVAASLLMYEVLRKRPEQERK